MAHDLALKSNGEYAMFFVGETPWHGHGQPIRIGATAEEAATAGGFNWQALAAPVTYTDHNGTPRAFGDKKILFRSDTGAPLSVVGDGYQVVQPLEVIDFFKGELEAQGWRLHTGGILDEGRRIWTMASRGGAFSVGKGDTVTENLLLATSLDGTLATTAALTSIRVVCANTLGMSLRAAKRNKDFKQKADGTVNAARVSHRSTFDASAIRRAMGLADQTQADTAATYQALAAAPISMEQARDILRGIFGAPVPTKRATDDAKAAAALQASALLARLGASAAAAAPMIDVREQRSVASTLALFAGGMRGADLPGVKGTAWGLLNAVTEHIDHEQGRDGTRLAAAWFGRGAKFKAEAFDAIAEAAGV